MKDCEDDLKLEEKLRKLDGTVIDIIDHCSINLYFLSENCFPTETWILRYQGATLFIYSSSINQMLKYRYAILSKNHLNHQTFELDNYVREDINSKLRMSSEELEKKLFFSYLAQTDEQTRGIQFSNYHDCMRIYGTICRLKFMEPSLIKERNDLFNSKLAERSFPEKNTESETIKEEEIERDVRRTGVRKTVAPKIEDENIKQRIQFQNILQKLKADVERKKPSESPHDSGFTSQESTNLSKSPVQNSNFSARSDSLTTIESSSDGRFRLFETLCMTKEQSKVISLKDMPLPPIGCESETTSESGLYETEIEKDVDDDRIPEPKQSDTDISSGSEHFRTFFGSSKFNFTMPKRGEIEKHESGSMDSSQVQSIHDSFGSVTSIIPQNLLVTSPHDDMTSRKSPSLPLLDSNNNIVEFETKSETTECLQAQIKDLHLDRNFRKYGKGFYNQRDVRSETGIDDEQNSDEDLARAVEEALKDQNFQRRFAQKYYSQCLKNGLPILH